jgi:hypothetical protein
MKSDWLAANASKQPDNRDNRGSGYEERHPYSTERIALFLEGGGCSPCPDQSEDQTCRDEDEPDYCGEQHYETRCDRGVLSATQPPLRRAHV